MRGNPGPLRFQNSPEEWFGLLLHQLRMASGARCDSRAARFCTDREVKAREKTLHEDFMAQTNSIMHRVVATVPTQLMACKLRKRILNVIPDIT
eukprot:2276992-Amphidinium_carterae.2